MSLPLKPPGPKTAAIQVVERERSPHGLTYDSKAQRAISADVYRYQAQLAARVGTDARPAWLGTLAHDKALAEFSD